jgi:hypothetical protein
MNPLERHLIYLLRDPRSGEPRYVGKSTSGIHRPRAHIVSPSCKQPYLYNWVNSLKSVGMEPEILVIERVPHPMFLPELEKYWIATLRQSGYRLVNLTDGGEGKLGLKHTEESKRRISETKKRKIVEAEANGTTYGMYGRSHSPEVREQIAIASRGRVLSSITRDKLSDTRKGKATRGSGWNHSEETRQKQSQRMIGNKRGSGVVFSEERKNKIRLALTGIKRSDETRKKISESKKRSKNGDGLGEEGQGTCGQAD